MTTIHSKLPVTVAGQTPANTTRAQEGSTVVRPSPASQPAALPATLTQAPGQQALSLSDSAGRFEHGTRKQIELPVATQGAADGNRMSPLGARLAAVSAVQDGEGSKPMKVGVLLTSHGDIDSAPEQLREYVREAVLKNPGLPLPKWIRPAIDKLGWPLQKQSLYDQYEQTGPTKYHENSLKQAAALDEALKEVGLDGKTYVGYNFLPPFIDDAVKQMKDEGVTHIMVFNQGAQNSIATMGESIGEVKEALEHIPDWDVKVTAVTEFNDDERFVNLMETRLLRDAAEAFPDHKPEETLLFITSHGLPQHLIDKGDPATADMIATVAKLKERLGAKGYQVEHGYLNDDFFPGATWTSPKAETRANEILEEVVTQKRIAPKHVLLDGRLSFTVHHRATLFDANIVVREKMEEPQGPPWARFPGAEVKLAPNFDGDPGLASLFASLTKDALEGKGPNLEVIKV